MSGFYEVPAASGTAAAGNKSARARLGQHSGESSWRQPHPSRGRRTRPHGRLLRSPYGLATKPTGLANSQSPVGTPPLHRRSGPVEVCSARLVELAKIPARLVPAPTGLPVVVPRGLHRGEAPQQVGLIVGEVVGPAAFEARGQEHRSARGYRLHRPSSFAGGLPFSPPSAQRSRSLAVPCLARTS